MQISGISFGTIDWSQIEQTEYKGESGTAYWRTQNFGDIRVRMVEYMDRLEIAVGAGLKSPK